MFGYDMTGVVSVRTGKSNGRSLYHDIVSGRVTITGMNHHGEPTRRVVQIADGEIMDNKLSVNGKVVYHVAYGKFERKGQNYIRFRKGTGTGKHGKSRTAEKLFGHEGTCHSWYSHGRLLKQKFVYNNGKVAYSWNTSKNSCYIYDPKGNLLYIALGAIDGTKSWNGLSVFSKPMESWFKSQIPFQVIGGGKVVYQGRIKDQQKVGEWIENGKRHYYIRGVQIPAKLYHTPPEKLDPLEILKLPNAQTRMALMDKIGPERIAECGKVIHSDKDMRLYDIENYDVRLLRVRCTTTKAFYFLKVPKDSTKCEQARQWTFHVGTVFNKPIKFEKET